MNRFAAIFLSVSAAAMIVSACTQQPATASTQSSGRQCFLASQANGYTPVSDEAVDVQVGANRYFRLELHGSCPNIDWSRRLALKTTGGGSWICQGLDAEIIVPEPGFGAQRCLVRAVRPLTKDEWLADRRKR